MCFCQCIDPGLYLTHLQCLDKKLSGFQVLTPAPSFAKPLNYLPFVSLERPTLAPAVAARLHGKVAGTYLSIQSNNRRMKAPLHGLANQSILPTCLRRGIPGIGGMGTAYGRHPIIPRLGGATDGSASTSYG